MKIAIASDLHLEFDAEHHVQLKRYAASTAVSPEVSLKLQADLERYEAPRLEADHPRYGPDWRGAKAAGVDLVLLAGDINIGVKSARYAGKLQRFIGCPVAFCAGNHDYWDGDLVGTVEALRTKAAEYPDVHFLECDQFDLEVEGRKISVLGTTLWTDFTLDPIRSLEEVMIDAQRSMNDYVYIKNAGQRLMPLDLRRRRLESRDWLHQALPVARGSADQVIVISHHAPAPESDPAAVRGRDGVPYYASDLREEIASWQPDLWVYGHVHYPKDFMIGQTRFVNAARGYIGHENRAAGYEPRVIEI